MSEWTHKQLEELDNPRACWHCAKQHGCENYDGENGCDEFSLMMPSHKCECYRVTKHGYQCLDCGRIEPSVLSGINMAKRNVAEG